VSDTASGHHSPRDGKGEAPRHQLAERRRRLDSYLTGGHKAHPAR
jgi:hypothetical protein